MGVAMNVAMIALSVVMKVAVDMGVAVAVIGDSARQGKQS